MSAIQSNRVKTPRKPRKTAIPEKKIAAEKPKPVVKLEKGAGGRGNKFEPTAEQRKIVMLMAATGATHEQMRQQILNPQTGKPIGKDAFKAHFAEDCENAMPKLNAMVAGSLYNVAMNPNHKQAATAAIFWLKTRAGWREPEPEWRLRKIEAEAEASRQEGGEQVMRFTLRLEDDKPEANG